MIRFQFALGFALLGAQSSSPMAIAQSVPNDGTTTKKQADGPAEPRVPVPAEYISSALNSTNFVYYGLNKIQANPLEETFGLTLSDADEVLRKQLEIPDGDGVVVVTVNPGGLADQAGLKGNDIVLSLGDTQAKGVAEVQKKLLGLTKEAVEVQLIRDGKRRRLSLVGPEHGFPAGAGEYWIGVPVSPVDATLRSHLPFLAAETGLVVNEVVKESPASKAGIEKGDILVAMGGKPLKSSEELIQQIQATEGKPVDLELIRAAKPLKLTVTPAKRSLQTFTRYTVSQPVFHHNASEPFVVSRPVQPFNTTVYRTQPYVAVEVAPKAVGEKVREAVSPDQKDPAKNSTAKPPSETDPTKRFTSVKPLSEKGAEQIQLRLRTLMNSENDAQTARLEAQIKELSTKLDEIRAILDGLKKLEEKK